MTIAELSGRRSLLTRHSAHAQTWGATRWTTRAPDFLAILQMGKFAAGERHFALGAPDAVALGVLDAQRDGHFLAAVADPVAVPDA